MRTCFKLAVILILIVFTSCKPKSSFVYNEGMIFGTIYHLTYESPNGKDLHEGIKTVMDAFNKSLSTYDPNSVISMVNSNRDTVLDQYFLTVFNKAQQISDLTNGAFDITVAPMVNVWGFGFKNKENVTTELIDSLKELVGYKKIRLVNGKIKKDHLGTMLDCSAIAKGYGVDVVADYLRKEGCSNYMVEIGGEVVVKGTNPSGTSWNIGISTPDENNFFKEQQMQAIISISDKAMATSGNYRNFYVEGGKKYAHTIDPATGYPVQHSLLSATVLSDNCMTADAFATAFMVLGVEKAKEIISAVPEIEAYLIYSDDDGKYKTWYSEGFKSLIKEELSAE